MMAQVIMDHSASWCFGTRLAPNYPSLFAWLNLESSGTWKKGSAVNASARIKRKTNPGSVLRSHRMEDALVHWTGDL